MKVGSERVVHLPQLRYDLFLCTCTPWRWERIISMMVFFNWQKAEYIQRKEEKLKVCLLIKSHDLDLLVRRQI